MQKQYQYKGVEIFYEVVGSGHPVFLLHGFGEDSKIWNEQVNFLKDHCQLIVPDLPGSGRSGMLNKEDITIEDYAEIIYELAENEKLVDIILLGHSMGGYITLAFAEKYAEKLKGFGLVHSTAFADNEEKKEARKKGIRLIEEHGGYSFLKNTTPNLFSRKFKNEKPVVLETFIEDSRQFTNKALIQYYTVMMNRPDRTKVLEQSLVPVIFIIGEEDVAAPLQDLLKQVHLPKISHIHILKEVGHMSMMEAPAKLNGYVLSYIESIL